DEADWRRHRRQRVARLAAARARDPAAADGAGRRWLDGGGGEGAAPGDHLVPADDGADEDGARGRTRGPYAGHARRRAALQAGGAARVDREGGLPTPERGP